MNKRNKKSRHDSRKRGINSLLSPPSVAVVLIKKANHIIVIACLPVEVESNRIESSPIMVINGFESVVVIDLMPSMLFNVLVVVSILLRPLK
jgi:hypothetical protein